MTLSCLLLQTPSLLNAAEDSSHTTFIAMGSSAASESMTSAKQTAIDKALTKTVEGAITQLLSPSQLTDHLGFILRHLTESPLDTYISTYKIIGESKEEALYAVAVEATIDMASLETFLKENSIISTESLLPKLLVLISEKTPDTPSPRFWWGRSEKNDKAISELRIIDALTSQGFPFVDGQTQHPDPETMGIFFTAIDDPEASAAFGQKLGADLVVLGTALSREAANVMGNERGYEGSVEIDIYSTQNGMKLAAISKNVLIKNEDRESGLAQALSQVGDKAAEALAPTLTTLWKREASPVNTIKANIMGADYLSNFIMLRKTLSTMTRIEDVQTRELSADQAIVEISYRGDGTDLANALMLKRFDTFGLELSDVMKDELTIRFVPKTDAAPVKPSEMEGVFISE